MRRATLSTKDYTPFLLNITRDDPPITRDFPPPLLIITREVTPITRDFPPPLLIITREVTHRPLCHLADEGLRRETNCSLRFSVENPRSAQCAPRGQWMFQTRSLLLASLAGFFCCERRPKTTNQKANSQKPIRGSRGFSRQLTASSCSSEENHPRAAPIGPARLHRFVFGRHFRPSFPLP